MPYNPTPHALCPLLGARKTSYDAAQIGDTMARIDVPHAGQDGMPTGRTFGAPRGNPAYDAPDDVPVTPPPPRRRPAGQAGAASTCAGRGRGASPAQPAAMRGAPAAAGGAAPLAVPGVRRGAPPAASDAPGHDDKRRKTWDAVAQNAKVRRGATSKLTKIKDEFLSILGKLDEINHIPAKEKDAFPAEFITARSRAVLLRSLLVSPGAEAVSTAALPKLDAGLFQIATSPPIITVTYAQPPPRRSRRHTLHATHVLSHHHARHHAMQSSSTHGTAPPFHPVRIQSHTTATITHTHHATP